MDESTVDKFYVPSSTEQDIGETSVEDVCATVGRPPYGSPADAAIVDQLGPPSAPQKSRPLRTSITYQPEDSSTETSVEPTSFNAFRRLQFDDEKNEGIYMNVVISSDKKVLHDEGLSPRNLFFTTSVMTPNESQQTGISQKKDTSLDGDRFETIVKSLSTRGFVVQNHRPLVDDEMHGRNDVENHHRPSAAGNTARASAGEVADSGVVDESSVFGQFACLSLLDGTMYGVRAEKTTDKRGGAAWAARVLATLGPHPHIISYYSSWADARFHYVQTELCKENLSSVWYRPERAADYRTVLEHVSCALYYMHDGKKYAHNRVNRWNIYYSDVNRVVYKLSGFYGATELPSDDRDAAAAATAADVRSLCTTVLRLMKDHGHCRESGDEELQPLRSYVSSVVARIDSIASPGTTGGDEGGTRSAGIPTGTNALDVWRWCCTSRQQQQQDLVAMVYAGKGVDQMMTSTTAVAGTAVTMASKDIFPLTNIGHL